MRIIIETTEPGGVETSVNEPTAPAQLETLDGGIPSEALIQAIVEALPGSAESAEIDAGSPPEWLVEAIEGSMPVQLRAEGSCLEIDAGEAPGREG